MEKMPYRPEMDTQMQTISTAIPEVVSTDWRSGLPVLTGQRVTLRELRMSDAASFVTGHTLPVDGGFLAQ